MINLKLAITEKKPKPFIGKDDQEYDYFWYKGDRQEDGVTIQFGSINGKYEVGQLVDVSLEKFERRDGKIGYKEVV